MLESGQTPGLGELRLHNGTIWRWNRPVYDVVDGVPHLRVENRMLPAGPTVVDVMANAAFYAGLVRILAEDDRPIWSRMSFPAAEDNLSTPEHATASTPGSSGPASGEAPVTELVLRQLLPMAHEGLDRWGVDADIRDRSARRHRAALPDPSQRGGVAGRGAPCPRRRPRRPLRHPRRHAPPLPGAHAQQRPGPLLALVISPRTEVRGESSCGLRPLRRSWSDRRSRIGPEPRVAGARAAPSGTPHAARRRVGAD